MYYVDDAALYWYIVESQLVSIESAWFEAERSSNRY